MCTLKKGDKMSVGKVESTDSLNLPHLCVLSRVRVVAGCPALAFSSFVGAQREREPGRRRVGASYSPLCPCPRGPDLVQATTPRWAAPSIGSVELGWVGFAGSARLGRLCWVGSAGSARLGWVGSARLGRLWPGRYCRIGTPDNNTKTYKNIKENITYQNGIRME
jgi:hypothetical protein